MLKVLIKVIVKKIFLKLLQTKRQVNVIIFNCNDLYYTDTKNKNDKEIVNNEHENTEIVYDNFDDFITPNHSLEIKPHETILK